MLELVLDNLHEGISKDNLHDGIFKGPGSAPRRESRQQPLHRPGQLGRAPICLQGDISSQFCFSVQSLKKIIFFHVTNQR